MLAVCVDFGIDLASLYDFLTVMKNTSDSLANELGCYQFGIAQDEKNQQRYFLLAL